MKAEVYHAIHPSFGLKEQTFPKGFTHVADVEIPDLASSKESQIANLQAFAFQSTNHIQDSWTTNDSVFSITQNPRSTSVGDVIEIEGKYYEVASCGFEEIKVQLEEFEILVSRTVSSSQYIKVSAFDEKDAEEIALDVAGDVDFGTGDNPTYAIE